MFGDEEWGVGVSTFYTLGHSLILRYSIAPDNLLHVVNRTET